MLPLRFWCELVVYSAALVGLAYVAECILEARCSTMEWSDFFIGVAGVALFFMVLLSVENARRASTGPPPTQRRQLRDDINQAGRDDWEDLDDGGGG